MRSSIHTVTSEALDRAAARVKFEKADVSRLLAAKALEADLLSLTSSSPFPFSFFHDLRLEKNVQFVTGVIHNLVKFSVRELKSRFGNVVDQDYRFEDQIFKDSSSLSQ